MKRDMDIIRALLPSQPPPKEVRMENKMEPTFYPLTGVQIGVNRETNSVTLEPRFLAFNKEHAGRAYSVPPEAVEQIIERLQEALKLLREDPPLRH